MLLLQATQPIGWDGRGLLTEGMLDTYRTWRHLQFLKFLITIREAALTALSTALLAMGASFDERPRLVVSGLRSMVDIDQAEDDLTSGARPLLDLVTMTA